MAGNRCRLRQVAWFNNRPEYHLVTIDHEIDTIMEMLGKKKNIPNHPGYLLIRYADELHDHGNWVQLQEGGDLRDVWADFDHIIPVLLYEVHLIWCASDAEHAIKQTIRRK